MNNMYEKQYRRLDELRDAYEAAEARADSEEMARIYEEIRELQDDLNCEFF